MSSGAKHFSLLGSGHPLFYPMRALRWELDALEGQMIGLWRARAAQQQEGQDPEPLLAARLNRLAGQRRQTRAALELLAASEPRRAAQ